MRIPVYILFLENALVFRCMFKKKYSMCKQLEKSAHNVLGKPAHISHSDGYAAFKNDNFFELQSREDDHSEKGKKQRSETNNLVSCMPCRGTTDAIFAVRQLVEKHWGKQKGLHMVFIDLEKAYDRVPRQEVWRCMRGRMWLRSM